MCEMWHCEEKTQSANTARLGIMNKLVIVGKLHCGKLEVKQGSLVIISM